MRKHNLAFIDIETTGMNMQKHEVLEIGGVVTDYRLQVLEEFEIKIKPENLKEADKTSLKINHYNAKDWRTAYSLERGMEIFSEKVKDCIMIGQNVAFDSSFLEYAFIKTGIKNPMHYHRLDTISLAWAKLHREPDLNHFSLREMCKRFNIQNENPHSALSDARATYELYKKLMAL